MGLQTSCCKSSKVQHSVVEKPKRNKDNTKKISIVLSKDQRTDNKEQEESAKETVEGIESQAHRLNALRIQSSNVQENFLEQDKNTRVLMENTYCKVIQESQQEQDNNEFSSTSQMDKQNGHNYQIQLQRNSSQQYNSENIINEYSEQEYIKSNQIDQRVWQGLDQINGGLLAVKTYTLEEFSNLKINATIYKKMLKLQNESIYFCKYIDIVKNKNQGIDILMQYISGGSIVNLLNTFKRFNENLTQIFTRQILMALSELHDLGIVHCNLKCSNILLDQSGKIKLSDVNIFEMNSHCKSMLFSQYSAPEILLHQKFSTASDIWSVGCIIIEMMTGINPWYFNNQVKSVQDITKQIEAGKFFEFPKNTQQNLKNFLTHIFRYDPNDRPSTKMLLQDPYLKEAAIEEQNLQNSICLNNNNQSFSRSLSSSSEKKAQKFNLSYSSIDDHSQNLNSNQKKINHAVTMHTPQKSTFCAFSKKIGQSIDMEESADNGQTTNKIHIKKAESINNFNSVNHNLNLIKPMNSVDRFNMNQIKAPSIMTYESLESEVGMTVNDLRNFMSQNSSAGQIRSRLDAMKEAPEEKENDNYDDDIRRLKNLQIREDINKNQWRKTVFNEIDLPEEEFKDSIQQQNSQDQQQKINNRLEIEKLMLEQCESINQNPSVIQAQATNQNPQLTAEQKRKELERQMLLEAMKDSQDFQQKSQKSQLIQSQNSQDQQTKINKRLEIEKLMLEQCQSIKQPQESIVQENQNTQLNAEQKRKEVERLMLLEMMKNSSSESHQQLQQKQNQDSSKESSHNFQDNLDEYKANEPRIENFMSINNNNIVESKFHMDNSNKENDEYLQPSNNNNKLFLNKNYSSETDNSNDKFLTPRWNKSNSVKLNQSDGQIQKKNDSLSLQKALSLNNLEKNNEQQEINLFTVLNMYT